MLFSTYLVHKQWTNQPVNNVSTCKAFYSKRNQNLLIRCFEAYNLLMNNKLRILLAQVNPTVGALNKNTDLLLSAYQEAKKDDIDIVAFPEMFLTGYQVQDLILKPSFLKDVSRYLKIISNECSGETSVLFGAPILDKGKLYNAYLQVKKGELTIITKKKHLPNLGIFDENRYFHSGKIAKVFKIKGLRIGCPICEDIWHSDVTNTLQRKGADLLLSPNGSPYERNKISLRQDIVRQRCLETNLPIIYLNLVGGQDDQVFDGGSFMMSKDGEIKMQLPQFEEKKSLLELGNQDSFIGNSQNLVTEIDTDIAQDYRAITEGTKDYVLKSGFTKVVLGLSGGIDSALVATIAVDALGANNVTCIRLPSQFSSKGSLDDADALVKKLGCKIKTIPISEIFDITLQSLSPEFKNRPQDLSEENIQSRIRGVLLMALSNKFGSMLLTTGNKSEVAVGYSTIYGDMCGGYNPIKDLYKTRLYDICKWRNSQKQPWMKGPGGEVIIKKILEKPPSAELRPGQKDEDSLPPYHLLDLILESLIENNMSVREVAKLGVDLEMIRKIEKLVYASEHKRFQSAPGVHLTQGSFWLSRRYPLIQQWTDPS